MKTLSACTTLALGALISWSAFAKGFDPCPDGMGFGDNKKFLVIGGKRGAEDKGYQGQDNKSLDQYREKIGASKRVPADLVLWMKKNWPDGGLTPGTVSAQLNMRDGELILSKDSESAPYKVTFSGGNRYALDEAMEFLNSKYLLTPPSDPFKQTLENAEKINAGASDIGSKVKALSRDEQMLRVWLASGQANAEDFEMTLNGTDVSIKYVGKTPAPDWWKYGTEAAQFSGNNGVAVFTAALNSGVLPQGSQTVPPQLVCLSQLDSIKARVPEPKPAEPAKAEVLATKAVAPVKEEPVRLKVDSPIKKICEGYLSERQDCPTNAQEKKGSEKFVVALPEGGIGYRCKWTGARLRKIPKEGIYTVDIDFSTFMPKAANFLAPDQFKALVETVKTAGPIGWQDLPLDLKKKILDEYIANETKKLETKNKTEPCKGGFVFADKPNPGDQDKPSALVSRTEGILKQTQFPPLSQSGQFPDGAPGQWGCFFKLIGKRPGESKPLALNEIPEVLKKSIGTSGYFSLEIGANFREPLSKDFPKEDENVGFATFPEEPHIKQRIKLGGQTFDIDPDKLATYTSIAMIEGWPIKAGPSQLPPETFEVACKTYAAYLKALPSTAGARSFQKGNPDQRSFGPPVFFPQGVPPSYGNPTSDPIYP